MSCRVVSCLVVSCRVVSCHVLSCPVVSCRLLLFLGLLHCLPACLLACTSQVHPSRAPIPLLHIVTEAMPEQSPRQTRPSAKPLAAAPSINQHADSLQQRQVDRAVPHSLLALGYSRRQPLPGALLSRACISLFRERDGVCVCVINYIYPATCDPRGSWLLLRFSAPDRNIRHSRAP